MLYAALFILGALIGYSVAKIDAFVDGLESQYGACNQNCRQCRDCACVVAEEAPKAEPQPAPAKLPPEVERMARRLEQRIVEHKKELHEVLSNPAASLEEVMLRQALRESIERLEKDLAEVRGCA